MLKAALQTQLLPEYQILYNLRMRLTDPTLKEKIAHSVQSIRKLNRRNGVNKLEAKLDKFGNDGEWYRQQIRESAKTLYKQKPISREAIGRWRSIEFELIFNSQKACDEFTYAVRAAGLTKFVTIQDDASIKRERAEEVPHEVVLSYRAGDEDAVRAFCKCLKGRAYVNYSCGTHFHLDARHLEQEKVVEYGNRLAQAVPALRLLLPRERRDSKYCQKNVNSINDECVRPYKYAFVNLAAYSKHRTIEVRGHSGTINAEKILNWIKVCETIMLTPIDHVGTINSVEQLIEKVNFDKELTAYIRERFMKFNDEAPNNYSYNFKYKTEGEEKPEQVEVPIHPKFLIPMPPAKDAQPAPKKKAVKLDKYA